MQAGECEFGLRLDADGRQDARAHSSGSLAGAIQQRRLADTRFAAEDQRSATIIKATEERVHELRLGIAPDEVEVVGQDRSDHRPTVHPNESIDSSDRARWHRSMGT